MFNIPLVYAFCHFFYEGKISTKIVSSVIATATETNYVDATAVSGTYYKYTVRAVNGKLKSTYTETVGVTR